MLKGCSQKAKKHNLCRKEKDLSVLKYNKFVGNLYLFVYPDDVKRFINLNGF